MRTPILHPQAEVPLCPEEHVWLGCGATGLFSCRTPIFTERATDRPHFMADVFFKKKFFFGGTGVWTQGFTLMRQALYCLRCSSKLLLWLFWRWGLTFWPGWPGLWSFYFELPALAGMTPHTPFSPYWNRVSRTFCTHLSWTMILLVTTS
jgi:hypothetical protein